MIDRSRAASPPPRVPIDGAAPVPIDADAVATLASSASTVADGSSHPGPLESPIRLRRLGPFLLIGQMAWAAPGAASSTLIAALIAAVDPAHKVSIFTAFSVAGAVTSAIGTVVGGLLSDRTRSRLGRRVPWLIAAAVVMAVAIAGVGLAGNLLVAGALYALFQLGIGTWVAALSALIPDHIDAGSVGRASSFAGLGYLLGHTIGGVIGGALVTSPRTGLLVAPVIVVIGLAAILLGVRGRDNRTDPRPQGERITLGDIVPRAPRDFWLAFAGRFLFILAILMVVTFQLYLLTDYLHLSTERAGEIVALATLLVGGLSAIGVIVAGVLSDRSGRIKAFVAGTPLVLGAGLIPFLISPGVGTELVFFGAVGLTLGAYLAVDQALMVSVLPNPETAARDLGFLAIGSTLPGVVAPLVGGAIASTIGYFAIFVVALVLSIAASAVVLAIRSVR